MRRNFSLATLFGQLQLGKFGFGIFSGSDFSLEDLGLGRLGQPIDGSQGNRSGCVRLPGLEENEKDPC